MSRARIVVAVTYPRIEFGDPDIPIRRIIGGIFLPENENDPCGDAFGIILRDSAKNDPNDEWIYEIYDTEIPREILPHPKAST